MRLFTHTHTINLLDHLIAISHRNFGTHFYHNECVTHAATPIWPPMTLQTFPACAHKFGKPKFAFNAFIYESNDIRLNWFAYIQFSRFSRSLLSFASNSLFPWCGRHADAKLLDFSLRRMCMRPVRKNGNFFDVYFFASKCDHIREFD